LPLYEYRCTSCGYSFEKIQSFSSEPERECPKCHGVLVRPISAPALRFEGAGWYVNDYAGKGAAKSAESSASSDGSGAKESKTGTGEGSTATPAPAASAPSTSTASN
jgi:putative FmdB family regulatory protein